MARIFGQGLPDEPGETELPRLILREDSAMNLAVWRWPPAARTSTSWTAAVGEALTRQGHK